MFRRAIFFDPELGESTGHRCTFVLRVASELQRRGIETRAFGRQRAGIQCRSTNIAVERGFKRSLFFQFSNDPDVQFLKHRAEYRDDFAFLDRKQFSDEDLLIFPSVFPSFLGAAADWVREFPVEKRPASAFLFQFGEFSVEAWDLEHYHAGINSAVRTTREARIRYFASSVPLAHRFTAILGRPVIALPMPVERRSGVSAAPSAQFLAPSGEKEICVGYLGHASEEKGGNLLPDVADWLQKEFPKTKLLLHLNSNWETEDTFRQISVAPPSNVELVCGHVTEEQMAALLDRCDVILLPYNAGKYKVVPSLIFSEALSRGKVVVIPRDTWMSLEALTVIAGASVFERFNVADICQALGHAIKNYTSLKRRADGCVTGWLERHGVDHFVERLLSGWSLPTQEVRPSFGWDP